MEEDAWIELGEPEYSQVWDRFEARFCRLEQRALVEPTPSVVYRLNEEALWWQEADFCEKVLRTFKECLGPEQYLYALDWQHACYRFWPWRMAPNGRWTVPLIPDGDSYHFISQDFKLGLLGDLYGSSGNEEDEPAVCRFGERFASLIAGDPPRLALRMVRRNLSTATPPVPAPEEGRGRGL